MLKQESKIIRLSFGEEDWIDVRCERQYRDTVKAQRAAATRVQRPASTKRGDASEAVTQFDFDVSAFNLSLLTTMIVAWSDENVPINGETVQDLPNYITDIVLEAILRDSRDEEERDPLEKTSTSLLEQPEASGQLEETEAAGLGA